MVDLLLIGPNTNKSAFEGKRLDTSRLLPGTLLVAHPKMKPNLFSKSVVLIVEYHNKTYKGLIVNKSSTYLLKDVMEDCSQAYCGYSSLYKGGPVNTSSLILMHTNEWYSSNTMQVGQELAISSDTVMTDKLSVDNVPLSYKLMAGMSQWNENQLRTEIANSYWLIVEKYNINLLFDQNTDDIWEMAIDYYSQNLFDQYF